MRFAKFIPSTVPRHIADRRKFGSCEIVHMTSKNDRRQRWARGGVVTCDYFSAELLFAPGNPRDTPPTAGNSPGAKPEIELSRTSDWWWWGCTDAGGRAWWAGAWRAWIMQAAPTARCMRTKKGNCQPPSTLLTTRRPLPSPTRPPSPKRGQAPKALRVALGGGGLLRTAESGA